MPNHLLFVFAIPDLLVDLLQFLDAKQYDRAVEAWANATILRPAHGNAWTNMAIVYDNLGMLYLYMALYSLIKD